MQAVSIQAITRVDYRILPVNVQERRAPTRIQSSDEADRPRTTACDAQFPHQEAAREVLQ